MDYNILYDKWINKNTNEDLKQELMDIKDNDKEIEDRFYTSLKFGTAGLRGKLGAGPNRMNQYTVAQVTEGLARAILRSKTPSEDLRVVIAYDVRFMSREFARTASAVLAAEGIKVYLYEDIVPTPLLSYSVRELNADAGIMITASHNPKEYNGYKVYGPKGSQILEPMALEIMETIETIDCFDVEQIDFDEGLESGIIEYVCQQFEIMYIALHSVM